MTQRLLTRATDGRTFTTGRPLGSGTQGEVWEATLDGRSVAVKVYHPSNATKPQRELVERLIAKGSPARHFLWPSELVKDGKSGAFGYVMELREPRFRSLDDFMARRVTASFHALLTACRQLADGFLQLHAKGLCYRDISFGNVFVDPETGDVRICDNDNIDISGAETGGVLGTPRFMAPEVVRREARPSDETDRYSLAVLMFYLLFGGHPLDGKREAAIKCMDIPALEKLYGREPVYIWDPKNDSNRPVPDLHRNPTIFRPLYPKFLLDLFERSFTEGLLLPKKRVRESEWRKAMTQALDSVHRCACEAENFHESVNGPARTCWSCRRALGTPPRLQLRGNEVVLYKGKRLFAYHLETSSDESIVGEVVTNPSVPSMYGIRNCTDGNWSFTSATGEVSTVPPGRAAPIVRGNQINFGSAIGEVLA